MTYQEILKIMKLEHFNKGTAAQVDEMKKQT
jgi:hypothetical protein